MTRKRTPSATTFESVLARRFSRRDVLRGGTLVGIMGLAAGGLLTGCAGGLMGTTSLASPGMAEVPHTHDAHLHVSPGLRAQILLRWGDAVVPGAPAFDPLAQTPEAQERQFGYNNDFIAFLPDTRGTRQSDRGLLCVNHEYTNAALMFPGLTAAHANRELTRLQTDIEMAAHGHSIVAVARNGKDWHVVHHDPRNRRLSGLRTACRLTGPAAGHPRLMTSEDPTGRRVIGSYNNCAGGTTPWGTVLIAEENIDEYFTGPLEADSPETRNHRRMDVGGHGWYRWARFHPRFDVSKEPNEPNRFGWVVEVDPYDPSFVPRKRTALGRFKHECATCALAPDGRVVVYSGDDERFEYLYRFVSDEPYRPDDLAHNLRLLDRGALSVARFDEDGSVTWLPLTYGEDGLDSREGFYSQADVLIETRHAAEVLGATPMDRPEDIAVSPVTGKVYVVLTNNAAREAPNAANPRAENRHGHILELDPPGEASARHHHAERFGWNVFLLAGDRASGARYGGNMSEAGVLSCPDNLAFDPQGRLWIATDGMPKTLNVADGLYVTATDGEGRAAPRRLLGAPKGAEVTGPAFTPDGSTLFVAIQHPGDGKTATFEDPATRWPDFQDGMPPRPSVVALSRA